MYMRYPGYFIGIIGFNCFGNLSFILRTNCYSASVLATGTFRIICELYVQPEAVHFFLIYNSLILKHISVRGRVSARNCILPCGITSGSKASGINKVSVMVIYLDRNVTVILHILLR